MPQDAVAYSFLELFWEKNIRTNGNKKNKTENDGTRTDLGI